MSSKRNLGEAPADVPTGEDNDNSYVSRSGHKGEEIPVVSDQERIEDPIDADVADSDEQLGMSYIITGRRAGLSMSNVTSPVLMVFNYV